jgi:glutamate transport system substrate-binding protein
MYALQTKGKIRIGALDRDPPFAERDAAGAYSGFEIELGRELAKAIFGPRQNPDSVIEWVTVNPSTAVATLTSGQADVVLARLAATLENASLIDQSRPYFTTGERVLVKASNDEVKDLPDLETRTVCTQKGSGVAGNVMTANAFARTLELDSYTSCLTALQRGQVDGIGAHDSVLWDLRKQDPDTKLLPRYVTTERYAIGVKKHAGDRQGFLAFLDTWLADAIRDGTWGRLYARTVQPRSGESRTSPTE